MVLVPQGEAVGAPVSASVSLQPVADTVVAAGAPTTAFGSNAEMDVYGGTSPVCLPPGMTPSPHYGLLKFDLSSVPDDAVITDVTLTLTSLSGYAQDGDPWHHAIVLDDDTWDESTTWATRPDDGTEGFVDPAAIGNALLRDGAGDLRSSSAAVGASTAFRADCSAPIAAEIGRTFPDAAVTGGVVYKEASVALVDFVAAAQGRVGGSGVLSLQVFNGNNCLTPGLCPAGDGSAYWERYASREAGEALSPRLTLVYTVDDGTVPVPVLAQAVPNADRTLVAGRLAGAPATAYDVEVLSTGTCTGGVPGATASLGTVSVTTDASGDATITGAVAATGDAYVVARTLLPDTEGTSALSACIVVGPDNDIWTRALEIPLSGSGVAIGGATGFLDTPGGARWYRFQVQPGAKATVTLDNLPADYDLAVFRDIAQTFTRLNDVSDLLQLSAEFAPSVFSPSVFSPSVFSPSVFSPDAYAPSVFSPSVFSPSVFSPSVFSPSVFSPDAFSPSVFSPSVFSPSVFSPSVFSPSVFSPDATAPSVFSPETFSSAQTRSLISFSATVGTAPESIVANTWNATGSFYVRVTGKNGASSTDAPFDLDVTLTGTSCAAISPVVGTPAATAGAFQSVVLWDPTRFDPALSGNSAAEVAALRSRLATFVARPDVRGVLVDVGQDPRVAALHAQADANPGCPFAKNLVAGAIKDHVDAYRELNPLRYVVVVGNDSVIPFFRYPDQALLGPESDYVPPVLATSASEASLRLNYVLGQDEYGARRTLALGDGTLPVPDLAVGRLVETAAEAAGMLDAYLGTVGGVVPAPTSALVTGYDFLEDSSTSVADDLSAGMGVPADRLITANGISPADPRSWTADDLRQRVLGARNDVMFLAGHFSANSALAADFSTSMLTTELAASTVDLTNSIVFSAGCHSGYTIVDGDAVPGVTVPLDWTQAFARKRATLIAGTGYQYGDTDFIEYSERLYAGFARQLRLGSGPVSVGEALVRSKLEYLQTTPDVRGLHRKSLLISTVFGLPMLQVDMPSGRLPVTDDASIVTAAAVTEGPGATLGLLRADTPIDVSGLTPVAVPLTDLSGGPTVTATYLRGTDGVVTNPAEPAVPLESEDVSVPGTVLRGVGFRGGSYQDTSVVPLTGAPTTELRGVHVPFTSPVFFPMRLATPNYFGAFGGGDTRLLVTPAQHRAEPGGIRSTQRRFTGMDLRLYYSANIETYGDNTPALAAPPSITAVTADADGDALVVGATVVGDPSAGVQEVWIAYTGHASRWDPLDLVQCVAAPVLPEGCDTEDSARWVGRLSGVVPADIRFMVQAANGVGLLSLDDNFGAYYGLAALTAAPVTVTSDLQLTSPPTGAVYGSSVTVSARLTADGQPLAGRTVTLGLGGTARLAVTGADGTASAALSLVVLPGSYSLTASFPGETGIAAASASAPFTVAPAPTTLTITTVPPVVGAETTSPGISATLIDANGVPLQQKAVTFTVTGSGVSRTLVAVTDFLGGRASLPPLDLPAGSYTVSAAYAGSAEYGATQAGPVPLVIGGRERLAALSQQLRALLPDLNRTQQRTVTQAITAIDRALAPGRWRSPTQPGDVAGVAIYADLSIAIARLQAVRPSVPAVDDAIAVILSTGRAIAADRIAAVAAGPNRANLLLQAQRELARGDDIAATDPATAMVRYGGAWSLAGLAVRR
jgi:hypothetical protein